MANYKRKGHRGRHKRRGITYNQSMRVCGNSEGKQVWFGAKKGMAHLSATGRNRIEVTECD